MAFEGILQNSDSVIPKFMRAREFKEWEKIGRIIGRESTELSLKYFSMFSPKIKY